MKPIDQLSDDEFAQLVRRAAALPDAPAAWVQAAIDRWHAGQASSLQAAAKAMLNRVAAALTFDSWTAPRMALGVRSMPSDTRHLVFSAQGRDIDVRIVPAGDHFALTGQVLGPDEPGVVEWAEASGAAGAQIASLDSMGEFRLEAIPRGFYTMTLRLGGDEILLPPVEVGERRR